MVMFPSSFLERHRQENQNTLRDILQLAIEKRPVPLDTRANNLKSIHKILHPVALNKEQRNKVLDLVKAILEQKQEGSNRPAKDDAVAEKMVNASNMDKEGQPDINDNELFSQLGPL